jgi:hypothetical protein
LPQGPFAQYIELALLRIIIKEVSPYEAFARPRRAFGCLIRVIRVAGVRRRNTF